MKEKLTEAYQKKIDQLQKDYSEVANSLGVIEMQFVNLEEKKKELKLFYLKLQKTENELIAELQQEYGEGDINLQDKTFTKVQK
jgi:predicted nuclease with TOPRIM domain